MEIKKKYKAFFAYGVGLFVPILIFVGSQLSATAQYSGTVVVDLDLTYQVTKDTINESIEDMILQLVNQSGTGFGYATNGFVQKIIIENGIPSGDEYTSVTVPEAVDKFSYAYLRQALPWIGGELVTAGLTLPSAVDTISYETLTWEEYVKALKSFASLIESDMINYATKNSAVITLKQTDNISPDEVVAVLDDVIKPSVVEDVMYNALLDAFFFDVAPSHMVKLNELIQESMTSEEEAYKNAYDCGEDVPETCYETVHTYLGVSHLLPGINDMYGSTECREYDSDSTWLCVDYGWVGGSLFKAGYTWDPYPADCQYDDVDCSITYVRRLGVGLVPSLDGYVSGDIVQPSAFYDDAVAKKPISESYAITDTMLHFTPPTQVVDLEGAFRGYLSAFLITPAGEAFVQNLKNIIQNDIVTTPGVVMAGGVNSIITTQLESTLTTEIGNSMTDPFFTSLIETSVDETLDKAIESGVSGVLSNPSVETVLGGVVDTSVMTAVTNDATSLLTTNSAAAISTLKTDVAALVDPAEVSKLVLSSPEMMGISVAVSEEFVSLATDLTKSAPTVAAILATPPAEPTVLIPAMEAVLDEATMSALMKDAIDNVLFDGTALSPLFQAALDDSIKGALVESVSTATQKAVDGALGDLATIDILDVEGSVVTALENEFGAAKVADLISASPTELIQLAGVGALMLVVGTENIDDLKDIASELSALNNTEALAKLAADMGITNVAEVKELADTLLANNINDIEGLTNLATQLGIANYAELNSVIKNVDAIANLGDIQNVDALANMADQFGITQPAAFMSMVADVQKTVDLTKLEDPQGLVDLAAQYGVTEIGLLPELITSVEKLGSIESVSDLSALADLSTQLGIGDIAGLDTLMTTLDGIPTIADLEDIIGLDVLADTLGIDASTVNNIAAIGAVAAIAIADPEDVAQLADKLGIDLLAYEEQLALLSDLQSLSLSDPAGIAALADKLGIEGLPDIDDKLALVGELQKLDLSDPAGVVALADKLGIEGLPNIDDKLALVGELQKLDLSDPASYAVLADKLGIEGLPNIDDKLALVGELQKLDLSDPASYAVLADKLGIEGLPNIDDKLALVGELQKLDLSDPASYAVLADKLGIDSLPYADKLAMLEELKDLNISDPKGMLELADKYGIVDMAGMTSLVDDYTAALGIDGADLVGAILSGNIGEFAKGYAKDVAKEQAEAYLASSPAGPYISAITGASAYLAMAENIETEVDAYMATNLGTFQNAAVTTIYSVINFGGPFGGKVANYTPCDCSKGSVIEVYLPVPTPGPVWVNPGKSKVYPYGNVLPNMWVLGNWEFGIPGGCWRKAKVGCTTVNYFGVVEIIGTS